MYLPKKEGPVTTWAFVYINELTIMKNYIFHLVLLLQYLADFDLIVKCKTMILLANISCTHKMSDMMESQKKGCFREG